MEGEGAKMKIETKMEKDNNNLWSFVAKICDYIQIFIFYSNLQKYKILGSEASLNFDKGWLSSPPQFRHLWVELHSSELLSLL